MKISTLFSAVGVTGMAAVCQAAPVVISDATYTLDPSSLAADADQDGQVDQPLSFTSITVGGTDYSLFTYGVASNVSETNRYYTPGEDPLSGNAALGGAIVTDGIINVREGSQVDFPRAITSNDLIFLTDLSSDTDPETVGIGLVDADGNRLGTAIPVNIAGPAPKLLDLETVGSVSGNLDLAGFAVTLADFGYSGTDAVGLEFTSSRDFDPSIVGLATIPEPASALSLAALTGLMLGRRRRSA